jgi:hypothetical protein
MIRLALVIAVLSASLSACSSTCPYGSTSGPGAGCKSRPEPSSEELSAALDGSAVANGMAAFKRSKEKGRDIAGFGVNGWGETTFTIPTSSDKDDSHYVTYDRKGAMAGAQDPDIRRNYATSDVTETFPLSKVKLPVLNRTLARIGPRIAKGRLDTALFSKQLIGSNYIWTIQYYVPGTGNVELQMNPDGSGLCMFGQLMEVRGVRPCAITGPASGTPDSTNPGTPSTKPATPPGTPDVECIQKAAGDVQKMQECLNP